MATITARVSRARRWARMTAVMVAFQASSSMAGANATNRGMASGSTSGGAFISRNSGAAIVAATSATARPIQLLAPSTARATASACSRRPAPKAWAMTTPTPAPTMRNTMNRVPNTWCANAKAAPDASEARAASTVPAMPTKLPSSSSTSSGQAMASRRGRAGAAVCAAVKG